MTRGVWAVAVAGIVLCGLGGWAWQRSDASARETVRSASPAVRPAVDAPRRTGDEPQLPAMPSAAVAATPDSRFRLVGLVVAPALAAPRESEALIAVDGLPPKSYRVGDAVVGAVVLQSIQTRRATLGPADGPAAVVLDLDPAAPPTTTRPATGGATDLPVIQAASAPAVDRRPVPVTDPDHGADTSNR